MVKADAIPEGIPKSGRIWKPKQTERASAKTRCGVLSHLKKTYEERKRAREELDSAKLLEKEMRDARAEQKRKQKEKNLEMKKRRMANEFKNSVYQEVKIYYFIILFRN